MKRVALEKFKPKCKTELMEGESIEQKVRRIVDSKEPITDGAPTIYTEKKDGVRPEYDIRTDKWDMAIKAMDRVNAAKIARSNGTWQPEKETKTEQKENGNANEGSGNTKGASQVN